MVRLAPALLLAALSTACSKKDDPPRPGPGTVAVRIDAAAVPAADAATVAPAIDAAVMPAVVTPIFHFDDLSKEDQVAYMKKTVAPAMKKAFRDFDGKAFKVFNCKTCHGKGAVTKEFDMPNPDLPELDFAELRAGEHAEMVKFMKEVVTPEMARMLGEPVQTDTTRGFGCLACHEEKK